MFDFARARSRIAPLVCRTPVLAAEQGEPGASAGAGTVALKLESLQHTGSFKVRGAASAILALGPSERRRGVVAASSGNHGRAVAHVAQRLGIEAVVCVPDWVDPSKLDAIRACGASVERCPGGYDEAEARAAELGATRGLTVIHAFDDAGVIEGQGTIMLELAEQMPGLSEVIVPLSGGGLVAGVGLVARELGVRVTAVSARRASVMLHSIRAGAPEARPDEPTIASALSGGIGLDNRHTFRIVREVVDEHVIVEENRIRAAVAWCFRRGLVVEGGGAVGIAALASGHRPSGLAAVVVSGGNIDRAVLAAAVQRP